MGVECSSCKLGLRAKALGITTAANWLVSFGVLRLTPVALENIQWKTYMVFGILCAAIGVTVYCFFPETMVGNRLLAHSADMIS